MKKKSILLLFILFSPFFFPSSLKANYWLIIGTYRQGPGGRPEVSGITSPSLHSIPMKDLDTCNRAGEKITNEIYKPVWQFDSKWTCVFRGENLKLSFNIVCTAITFIIFTFVKIIFCAKVNGQ